MNNSIFTIRPYRRGEVWCFDEPSLNIHAEPFVGKTNAIIDAMLIRVGLDEDSFTALFSSQRFPSPHLWLQWSKEEYGGNWYHDETTKLQGWLCPCLLRFFSEAPKNIYVSAQP